MRQNNEERYIRQSNQLDAIFGSSENAKKCLLEAKECLQGYINATETIQMEDTYDIDSLERVIMFINWMV